MKTVAKTNPSPIRSMSVIFGHLTRYNASNNTVTSVAAFQIAVVMLKIVKVDRSAHFASSILASKAADIG